MDLNTDLILFEIVCVIYFIPSHPSRQHMKDRGSSHQERKHTVKLKVVLLSSSSVFLGFLLKRHVGFLVVEPQIC